MLIEKDAGMNEFESKCYGMSEADIQEQYMHGLTARCSGLEMVVMSILSDAQELIACNSNQTQEQARKELNRAKYILSKMLEEKSSQVA
jgi:hypothetical protein